MENVSVAAQLPDFDVDPDLAFVDPTLPVRLGTFPITGSFLTSDHSSDSVALINDLIHAYAQGRDVPPIVVYAPERGRRPHDLDLITGAHRLTAAWLAGRAEVPAYVVG